MACDAPLSIRYNPPRPDGKGGLIYYFPGDCGKCLNCLKKRKAQWAFRLAETNRVAFSSYFVTLTYDDKNVPVGDGVLTINYDDHKTFIHELKAKESPKALAKRESISGEEHSRRERKILERGKFAYYGVAEYGDGLGRPHFHYLLFNVRDTRNIETAWGKGIVDIDPDVNINNIDYVLKYMVKDHSKQEYENREKEKSWMSKGIGSSAASDLGFTSYIRKTNSTQVCTPRNTKIGIPRYYRKKYLTESERLAKGMYIARLIKGNAETEEKRLRNMGVDYDRHVLKGKEARLEVLKTRQKRNYE